MTGASPRANQWAGGNQPREDAMTGTTFDTLATARNLKKAGIADDHAEAITEAVNESRGNLADKGDIAGIKADITAAIASLRVEISNIKTDAAERETRSARHSIVAVGLILTAIAVAVALIKLLP